MYLAITREVSPAFASCELTHLERQPIDVQRAEHQHHAYEDALRALGCEVVSLPAEAALPDSVFVEDTAVIVDEAAILTRPGADSRKPETASIARALEKYRPLYAIQAPGTLDGGDVLRLGKRIYVGLTTRSNPAAIEQMNAFLGPYGYTAVGVPITGCLHLKSAVTQVAGASAHSAGTLLVNPAWIDVSLFGGWKLIEVDPSEPSAANALLIGETIIYPANYPLTRSRLEAQGIPLKAVDISEMIKAEGAVTCCSLVFQP